MRRGIGLRGYAQQDPLNEFRKEAFRLYEELRGPHPPPGRDDDLPGHRAARAGDGAALRPRPAAPAAARSTPTRTGRAPGSGHDEAPGGGPASTGTGVAGGAAGFGGGSATARRRRRGRRRDRHACAAPMSGLAADPMRDRARVPGDAAAAGGSAAGLHPDRRADRAQRPVLVRVGPEVQEVSRGLSAPERVGILVRRSPSSAGLAAALVGRVRRGPDLAAGRHATRSDRRTRSSCSVPPSTTAGRRPCSRPGSSTPSRCTGRASPSVRRDRRQAPGDRTTEAAVARDYAIAHGVPASAIFGEDEAAQHPGLAAGGRRRAGAAGAAVRGVRLRPDPHVRVLRIATDLGHRGLRVADADVAVDVRPGRRLGRRSTSSARSPSTSLTGGRRRSSRRPADGHARERFPRTITPIGTFPANSRSQTPVTPLECVEPPPILGRVLRPQGPAPQPPPRPRISSAPRPNRHARPTSEGRSEGACEAG